MKKLSDSEFEIMKALWSRDGPMTSNGILEGVRDKYGWKLAGADLDLLEREVQLRNVNSKFKTAS